MGARATQHGEGRASPHGPAAARFPARAAAATAPALATPLALGAGALVACVAVGVSGPDAGVLPPCPFRAVTGWDCPACGMSRGVRALVRGHLGQALDYNVLLAVAVPAVAYLYLRWLASARGARWPLPRAGRLWPALLTAVIVAFAIVRNLPIGIGRYLNSAT